MKYLKLVFSILKWMVFSLIVWVAKAAAYVLAPIAALPIFVKKGEWKGRESDELISFWRWTTTHDAPIDEYYMSEYYTRNRIFSKHTREDILNNGFLKYLGRVFWIWRNPAYVVADALGYSQKGMKFLHQRDEGHLWDSGYPNFSYYIVENNKNQIGWMLEWQWYFYKQRCLEVYLGWKIFRKDENQRCMLVARITPFKKYEKKF